ncbi:EH domain-containing protein [Skeletonema marinoi]|uniref:EH domain-containing protein n=1 Tax=Skeletonema marinoi TaxID=267567 RepID=A0AAD9DI17_9STRA|nr:EH domain-containing protein [Skeletonema marinoi]
MSNWAASPRSGSADEVINKTNKVSAQLKAIYKDNILPAEKRYRYDYFYESPFLTDVEFDAKPQVMLVGQYSVGKTSFIRYMLGRDFPGARIGPEPTTDRFTCLINGPEERTIPGNALSVHPDLPFRGLERFGVSFLSRFEGSQLPSSVLRSITLVDTPGILSGEKQRGVLVCRSGGSHLLLFDAHKLDISDELKATIDVLKGHEDKVRCILNKADQINRQQLMRVYGSLLWSLGKTINSPEVLRVYVGSFWHEPLQNLDNAELFESEESDLMRDLAILPRQSAVRKINELVKRIRKVKALAYIIGHLKSQMPAVMGKDKKQQKLISDMPNVFRQIMKKHNLAPDSIVGGLSVKSFAKVDGRVAQPSLVRVEEITPMFLFQLGRISSDADEYWALEESAERLKESFEALGPQGGFLSPQTAKEVLVKTGLQKEQLRQIWALSDIDRDGYFDHHEYVVAMFLCDAVMQKGRPIPAELPMSVIPPSKRPLLKERGGGFF